MHSLLEAGAGARAGAAEDEGGGEWEGEGEELDVLIIKASKISEKFQTAGGKREAQAIVTRSFKTTVWGLAG